MSSTFSIFMRHRHRKWGTKRVATTLVVVSLLFIVLASQFRTLPRALSSARGISDRILSLNWRGFSNRRRANLLFMPVGDKGVFKDLTPPSWLRPERNFDVLCVYYNNDARMLSFLRKTCDSVYRSPVVDSDGMFHAVSFPMNQFKWWTPPSKMQAFFRMWHAQEPQVTEALQSYSSIGIWDDDADILKGTVDYLFDIVNNPEYKLDVASPSFLNTDSTWASYATLHHLELPGKAADHMRMVPFAEVNFPVMTQKAVAEFMNVYNDELIAYGTDVLYSCMWPESIAVINNVLVANRKKRHDGVREVAAVYGGGDPNTVGHKNWTEWAKKRGFGHCTKRVFEAAKKQIDIEDASKRIPIPPVNPKAKIAQSSRQRVWPVPYKKPKK